MSDKYAILRRDLPELVADAKRQGGINPRAQLIIDLLAERDELAANAAHPPAQDEAVRRDAERYRWLRDRGFAHADVSLGTDCDGDNFVGYRITFNLPEPTHNKFEDDEWEADDIDAAIDAAIAQRGEADNARTDKGDEK